MGTCLMFYVSMLGEVEFLAETLLSFRYLTQTLEKYLKYTYP